MPTVSRGLPKQPHLDVPKREARELLAQWRKGELQAFDRIRRCHPRLRNATDQAIASAPFRLSDAQLVVAGEYGFPHWTALKQRIQANALARELDTAIRDDDRETAIRLVRSQPQLLHVPVISGNWGPPMSHAANMGRLELVKAFAELGARDHQHAFDRAILQGQIECARWLQEHGATLAPGLIMGPCETLNITGFDFLLQLGAPLTDKHGNRLAPLGLVLETYARNPAGKHAILAAFAARGYELPDTPMMALHRGDIERLEAHLRRDPGLLERQFTSRDIYPPACGCGTDALSGMHWTPIAGATLLHVAIDFREREIFDWLLARGADVDVRAAVDSEGFGGHTPLFNCVVNGPQRDATMAAALIERGADRGRRASLRKFLDWRETPSWHIARDVTPGEWGRGFPEQGWVNTEALNLIEQ